MHRSTTIVAAGLVGLAGVVALPVWAQSGGDNTSESASAQAQPQPPQAQNNRPQPPKQPGAMGQPMDRHGPDRHGPDHHRPDHHGPKMADGPMAGPNPLRHVCLSKSEAYSPGAVVTMYQKPYTCQALPEDTSGTLHWVAVNEDE